MLQFWKKSGSKESSKSNPPSPVRSPSSQVSPSLINGDTCGDNGSGTSLALLARLEEEEEPSQAEDAEWRLQCRSRLSMSLQEVIADKGALGYFIQFLEARAAGALIRFYLDVECFRSAAHEDARTLRIHKHQANSMSEKSTNSVLNCDNLHSPPIHNQTHNETSIKAKENHMSTENDFHEIASAQNDAVRIFEKYLGLNALLPIPVGEDIRNSVALALCRQGDLDPECFIPAQTLCFEIMEEEYFNEFLRSDFYCKHQIDVLTSGDVGLTDILYNQASLFYFMEFMEQEDQRALLEFWLAAHNFSSQLQEETCDKIDVEQAQSDAIVLYEKYFSLQATCPLGFSDKIRVEIEQHICSEGGPQPSCFSRPLRIVLKLLHKNYFKPFLQSQLYFKYLSELINTIQATKNGSDSGSEVGTTLSLNTNTLLAGGDSSFSRKVLRNMEQQNLSIDSRQLYDPDFLWRRRHHSGLSFGRINELGRFETEVEPEPDKKSESRITRAMKKLVNMDEDKAKEEMAWQIAEMIVKDVTSLTLHEAPTS